MSLEGIKAEGGQATPMTHPQLVKALCKDGKDIALDMTYSDAHLIHMVMGISGEAGEILDAVKKVVIYHKRLDRENIVEELGDLEFYMEGLRQGLGITREEVLQYNINKLNKRYAGAKYSDAAAQARADKVEEHIFPKMVDAVRDGILTPEQAVENMVVNRLKTQQEVLEASVMSPEQAVENMRAIRGEKHEEPK